MFGHCSNIDTSGVWNMYNNLQRGVAHCYDYSYSPGPGPRHTMAGLDLGPPTSEHSDETPRTHKLIRVSVPLTPSVLEGISKSAHVNCKIAVASLN